jgi:hypothetical protein
VCGEKDLLKLCFHHIDSIKDIEINKLSETSWTNIKKELLKCDLYCQNCHQEYHDVVGQISNRRNNKKIYFEYVGESSCSVCGYDKCPSSLNFHHKYDKLFNISVTTSKICSINDLSDKIQNELDKCDILCRNCHSVEHSDFDFFYNNLDEIIKKANDIKYKQIKIDREQIFDMYFNKNMKQIEIAKFFNASKGTISDIIKSLKLKINQ